MDLTRLLSPAAVGAVLVAAAVALAPAASAATHHASGHRSAALPAASKVVPAPGKQVTITPSSNPYSPTTASLDWTIPACRGTVYAWFTLDQGGSVYLKDKGGVPTAYTCRSTPQTVTVRYAGADPSQGALTAGRVKVTVTTHSAPVGGTTYKTRIAGVDAVVGPAADPDPAPLPTAADVVPVPAGEQVTVVPTGQQWFPTYATLDWTLPACRGTVYAYFQLDQAQPAGTQTYVQEKGMTAYPCTSTPQTLHVKYNGVDPSARALVAGQVDLTVKVTDSATSWQDVRTSTAHRTAVVAAQGS